MTCAISANPVARSKTAATPAAANTDGDIAFNITFGFAIGMVGDLSRLAAPGHELLLGSGGGITQQAVGVAIAATLADGRPLPTWLHLDGAKGVLAGILPADTAGVTLVRLTVRMASGEQGEILLQLSPQADKGVVAKAGE